MTSSELQKETISASADRESAELSLDDFSYNADGHIPCIVSTSSRACLSYGKYLLFLSCALKRYAKGIRRIDVQ